MKKLTTEKCREFIRVFKSLEKEGHLALTSAYHLQALEIALPILEQQERGDGWIEWGGGNCPVPENSRVDIKFRDGDIGLEQGPNWDWSHLGYRSDIIAYRIIPEQPTNQNGEQ